MTREHLAVSIRRSMPEDAAAIAELTSHCPEAAQWPREAYLTPKLLGQSVAQRAHHARRCCAGLEIDGGFTSGRIA